MKYNCTNKCINGWAIVDESSLPGVYRCQECCEHEFDWDEGYTCLNCGLQGDIGELIDALEYGYGEDR